MDRLRVIFMGTPEFSVPALESLVNANYEIVGVYSQPPRPSGRGHKVTLSPVHQKANSLGIPVFTPKSLRSIDAQAEFASLNPDIAIVVAYGLILPKEILDTPHYGCLNIHGSLLPRWRGAAPLQRAIMAGDEKTGVTIMKMDEGLDTGPMLSKAYITLNPSTTSTTLHDEMRLIGADLLIKTIDAYIKGTLLPEKQPDNGITYADKLSKTESMLDWANSSVSLDRKLRALTPWPGVYFTHNNTIIKVREAVIVPEAHGTPGEIIDDKLTIACGDKGGLRLLSLQRPGGKWLSGQEFLNGYPLPKGTRL